MTALVGYRRGDDPERLVAREWLVTNGIGGYASGTIAGVPTRRFHGLLVSALPAPLGRVMMLNHLLEMLVLPTGEVMKLSLDDEEDLAKEGLAGLAEFRLEAGLPVWRYEIGPIVLERRIVLPHGQNTAFIHHRLLASPGPVELVLRPSVHFRLHEASLESPVTPYTVKAAGPRWEVSGADERFPSLRLRAVMRAGRGRAELILDGGDVRPIRCSIERARGYDCEGPMFSPGLVRFRIASGEAATLVASTEPWEIVEAMSPMEAFEAENVRRERLLQQAPDVRGGRYEGVVVNLVLAADQFVIAPQTRPADEARAHARGDHARTIIAGYHWFTDWGRDTMIALEGLTLITGRIAEAGCILRTFAHHARDGLIPNLFPEGQNEGLYHTADATLWFFHAVDRYVQIAGDHETRRAFMPVFREILLKHVRGTRFGIRVDPDDGLLTQGEHGYQLTWMDAKVGDWVVTPRRGKAVEINALFYNALCLLRDWSERDGDGETAHRCADLAARLHASFNRRFWCDELGHLYDVVDGEHGDDRALRPNQLFAISLPHAVLETKHWASVLRSVERELLTPVGLRSLSPRSGDYKARYDGDLRARDAAYHQGTVWGWLVGPYVDAYLRVHPNDFEGAARVVAGVGDHAADACVGTLSEIFDGDAPYLPRGCVAQAWSVAEALRALTRISRRRTER